jgi:hypothetical protein
MQTILLRRGDSEMNRFLLTAILAVVCGSAQAQFAAGNYVAVNYASATIATGGTAQSVTWTLTAAKIRCVQNPKNATEDLYVAVGSTASTTSQDLPAGIQVCWPWNGSISVFAATTGHAFTAFEAQ